jgi:hypothetical protein
VTGPKIRAGSLVKGASVLDVAPTLLHLIGLQVGRDMDGRVLAEALKPEAMREQPITYIDSWEDGSWLGEGDDAVASEALLEQLRGLGYL